MQKKYKKSLVWLRRDLRLTDHKALSEATSCSEVVCMAFVFDTEILGRLKNRKDLRLTFIYETLLEIDILLQKYGSHLIVLTGNPITEIPKLMSELKCDALFFNEDYEPYALSRDKKIEIAAQKINYFVHKYKDQVVFSGTEILKNNGESYQVFTPYKKAWIKKLTKKDVQEHKVGTNFVNFKNEKRSICFPALSEIGFEKSNFHYDFQQPGRNNAIKIINSFSMQMADYHKDRDFPFKPGTSGISVHLRFGTISVRECLRVCLRSKSQGHLTWLSEIIWREFYQMILLQFPYVTKSAFKAKYEKIKWPGKEEHFLAWCEGKTGYPIVDAAMRQLNSTGWMHNRLRMIVASFLTKDLLVDWRKGEAYFAEKLLDFDLASNNGGWQWSASTGCDAQPYFRIFNPELQSQKFDPNGEFLRAWLPELKDYSDKEIHAPLNTINYPLPIVQHKTQKNKAIQLFKI